MKAHLFLLMVIFSLASSIIPESTEAQQASENFWAYYPSWSMGRASYWSINSTYYMPTRTLFANRGKITDLIIFPHRDNLNDDYAPYLSTAKEWADSAIAHGAPDNSTTRQDSLNFFYNGQGAPEDGKLSTWISRGALPELIDSCRKVGIRVHFCINTVSPTAGWNAVVTDSTKTEMFVQRCGQFLDQHGFDGIVINLENTPTTTMADIERFFRRLRLAVGTKIIASTPPPTKLSTYATVKNYHDYIIPQFYVYHAPYGGSSSYYYQTFLSAPIYPTPRPRGESYAISDSVAGYGPNGWYQAGWPKSKIVVLFTTQAFRFLNVDTMWSGLPGVYASIPALWADTAARHMLNLGGVETWDNVHCGSYIHGTATAAFKGIALGQKFYIPFLSKQNIDSIISWSRRNGYNSYGIYDIGADAVPNSTPANPLVTYISSKLNTSIQPVIPLIIATPNKIIANGISTSTIIVELKDSNGRKLPTSGNTVTLSSTLGTLGTVSNNGDSTYSAVLTASITVGTAIISGTLNTAPISNTTTVDFEAVLPVQVTSFIGALKEGTVVLKWKTETEVNNYGFEVERRMVGEQKSLGTNESNQSLNGSTAQWLKIGFVAGSGTSNSSHEYEFSDQKPVAGRYVYRLKQIDSDGPFNYSGSVEVEIRNDAPTVFSLEQNYPNPFNPSTTIRFGLPTRSKVKLEVFNILGQIVTKLLDGEKEAGFVEANWYANVASGLYIYRIEAVSTENPGSRFIDVKKMMLLK